MYGAIRKDNAAGDCDRLGVLFRIMLPLSGPVYDALMELRTWLFRHVYNNPGSRENAKAAGVVTALFEYYLAHPEERVGSGRDPVLETVDFVAGMTDRYAIATYRRLFLPRGDAYA